MSSMKKALSALVLPLLVGQTELSAQSPRPPAPIVEQYGVADDGTLLTWQVFPARGAGKHPNVLVIHGGGFDSNPPTNDLLNCAKDLSKAGMNAFIISYRLAPPGLIPGQKSDGRYPDQSNDVLLAVHAARIDSRGNGKVGAVGGSAGGSHTVYVAATGIPGDTRIDAGVSLSGAYNYGDKTSWKWQDGSFLGWVSNYVDSTRAQTLYAASPIAFVKIGMPPLFLYASDSEPMPPQQLTDLMAQLDSVKVKNYQSAVIPGRAHAFALWGEVSAEAIAFLLPNLQL